MLEFLGCAEALEVVEGLSHEIAIDEWLCRRGLEPDVVQGVAGVYSLFVVDSEHLSYQILGLVTYLSPYWVGHAVLSCANFSCDFFVCRSIKWGLPRKQDVHHHANGPDVAPLIVIHFENFGCDVVGGTMHSFEFFPGLVVFYRCAKVYYFENVVLFFVYQNIFWFQISVDNSEGMTVSDPLQYLRNNLSSVLLAEGDFIDYLFEELTAFAVFCDQEVFFGVFEYFVELQDVGVIKLFKCRHFRFEAFPFFIVHLFFLYYFDGALGLGRSAHANAHFTKGSLPKDLTQLIEIPKLSLIHRDEVFFTNS